MAARKNAKSPAGKNAAEKLIQGITNRYRVTAREARDIVTAVGTHMNSITNPKGSSATGPSGKNLTRQVGEVFKTAATGKKGTTSDKIPVSGPLSAQYQGTYTRGQKRK